MRSFMNLPWRYCKSLKLMVGATGFEPATSTSQILESAVRG
jgi:hypothetical protein